MDDSPSPRNFFGLRFSQRVNMREPSWISFHERQDSVAFPQTGVAKNGYGRMKKALSLPLRVLAIPLKSFRNGINARNKNEVQEVPRPRPRWSRVDPVQAWKTRVRLLETEVERLNKEYSELLSDYSRMYTRATTAESDSAKAQNEAKELRGEVKYLCRVIFERSGREEYLQILETIDAHNRRRHGASRRNDTPSTTTLAISLNDNPSVSF